MAKINKLFIKILGILFLFFAIGTIAGAQETETTDNELKVIETTPAEQQSIQAEQNKVLEQLQKVQMPQPNASSQPISEDESVRYTLGAEDVVEVTVLRHPEFSGIFPVNLEGKIQPKFLGDIEVTGLTKKQLEEKLKKEISVYVINPEVNVTILEYKSKYVYVIGEVSQAGKYYIRSESIKAREAVTLAGLPTLAAAMRKCQIITPDKGGNPKVQSLDLYSILYKGDLSKNLEMKSGDVLYVPSTVMAKLVRIINPVTATVNGAASGPEAVATGKTSVSSIATGR